MAWPLTAVIVAPPASKLSLPSTLIAIGVSSLVTAASLAMSTTGSTATGTLAAVVVRPSLTEMPSVAVPLKSGLGWKVDPASAALMAVALPLTVTVPLPLPATATPAVEPSVNVPLPTVSVTVSGLPSTSATVIALPLPAENTNVPSSVALCAAGTLTTGASLTAVIARLQLPGADTAPLLSVTVKPMVVLPNAFGSGRKTSPAACAAVKVWPTSTGVTPSASSRVPSAGNCVTVTELTVPSTSVPTSATGIVESSAPVPPPFCATGGSFTGSTVIDTTPLASAGPLLTV